MFPIKKPMSNSLPSRAAPETTSYLGPLDGEGVTYYHISGGPGFDLRGRDLVNRVGGNTNL